MERKEKARERRVNKVRMSGGRRQEAGDQQGGLRGSVWDRGKEPKSRQVQLLNCGRVATGLGTDTVHPAPAAGLRVQRALTAQWQRWQRQQMQRSGRARPSSCSLAPRPGSASPGPATRPPARSHPRRAATSHGTVRNPTRPAPGG